VSDSLLSSLDDEAPRVSAQLDASQRIAVEHPAATLRILAGPGSGKTRVLTTRIERRVIDGSADPRHVLALTFTRRAAGEIRSRLRTNGVRDVAHVGTFHAIALQQLRQHRADHGRLGPELVSSRPAVIRSLAPKSHDVNAAITQIERAASRGTTAAALAHRRRDPIAQLAAELHSSYNAYKKRKGLLDFDDILTECTRLLRDDHVFAAAQRWRFRHLFVDEFQDVNRTQFELLQAWLGDRDDLCVVGDADQAIYGWNGADARFLTDFEIWYPNSFTVSLAINHRSAAPVIEAAHAVLGHRDVDIKKLSGVAPAVSAHETPVEEAADLAARLRWRHGESGRWSSHAVLARTNAQLEIVVQALEDAEIPFHVRGRGGISRRPGAKAALDALNRSGDTFGTVLADLEFAEDPDPEAAGIVDLANDYASSTATPTGPGFAQWMRTIRAGDVESDRDAVDLVTFHAAKGLEWKHVAIIGFEEGLVPMSDSEEEQRLAYVAVTRAELSVHLSWCRTRPRNGQIEARNPSRWLDAIAAATAPSVPAAAEQVRHHIEVARDIAPQLQSSTRRQRLIEWRAAVARARRVDPVAILRDDHVDALAASTPHTTDDVAEITGLSKLRIGRDAGAILQVLTESVH